MTVEEIYLKLKDELTAENESSTSPERIFIKNEEQTICTLGMNRSHEIIFVEFKPAPKELDEVEREVFVHPHPVEMLHNAGWRQAQVTSWEEAEKLLEIVNRSYKRKRPKAQEEVPVRRSAARKPKRVKKPEPPPKVEPMKVKAQKAEKPKRKVKAKAKPARKVAKPKAKTKSKPKARPKAKAKTRLTTKKQKRKAARRK